MKVKVQKWGNSLAVRLPHAFAHEVSLEPNSTLELSLSDGRIILTPCPHVPTLDELLDGITDENTHPEFGFGPPVGREIL